MTRSLAGFGQGRDSVVGVPGVAGGAARNSLASTRFIVRTWVVSSHATYRPPKPSEVADRTLLMFAERVGIARGVAGSLGSGWSADVSQRARSEPKGPD